VENVQKFGGFILHSGNLTSGAFKVAPLSSRLERGFFIDNLLVRIHFIIEMIWWTGLAPR